MTLTIINATNKKLSFNCDFQRIMKITEQAIGKTNGIINVIFCDNRTSRTLNRMYRKKNKPTNVLTFTYRLIARTPNELLAEIYLNVPYIQKEAKQDHQAFSFKLFILFIHGLLHSRGYDHKKDRDYRIMKLLEDKILKRFLLSKKS